jgi:indolepyruvate ferredoxin oxidoreductase alpha subunit
MPHADTAPARDAPAASLPADGASALAWAALEAGVGLATGYPGAPSGTVFARLEAAGGAHGLRTEWCVNERVALDMAAGASLGGRRALVCVKGVGLNVALDTLMHLNLTGAHAGLVILLGDDPGAWGSGTEQDSRLLAALAELPLLEPGSGDEGRAMLRWAFEFSEAQRSVVIVRITRSFTQCAADPVPPASPPGPIALPPDRAPGRWLAVRGNAVANHRRLHAAHRQAAALFEDAPFNTVTGTGPRGIVTGGFVHEKFLAAADGVDLSSITVLKLGTLHPLPPALVTDFLEHVDEVLVLEENDPFLEDALKTVGYASRARPPIRGKRSGHVAWEGELFRWQIQRALEGYLPGFAPERRYREADWEREKPQRRSHMGGCRYAEILAAFREEATRLGLKLFVAADPCGAVLAPQQLDAKLSMGSAIGAAIGFARAGNPERVVAVTGDSNFYHGALNALIQAQATRTDLLVVLLDNGGALTTGGQPTPDRGLPLPDGGRGPIIGIADLAAACGLTSMWIVDDAASDAEQRVVFREALAGRGAGLIVVRHMCGVDP